MTMETIDVAASEDKRATSRMRTKKKSTLAKLKEKKLREQGSSTSLQSHQDTENINSSSNSPTKLSLAPRDVQSKIIPSAASLEGDRVFSTKDPHHAVADAAKPKPRPRGRRQHSSDGKIGRTRSDDREDSADSGSNLQQRLKDLKMTGPYGDNIDSTISNSGFIPKPPVTPRTPSSNPRTPRAYVALGKGEKRSREQRSSGEEPEVEEKKERNLDSRIEAATLGGTGTLNSHQSQETDNTGSLPHQTLGQVKTADRLLKRRSSKDSTGEPRYALSDTSAHVGNGIGKPPVCTTHRNTNNNSNHSHGSDLPYPASLHQSPRGKYLKSASKSLTGDQRSGGEDSDISPLNDLHISGPPQVPMNPGTHSSPSHMPGTSSTSVDLDSGNKSTQVIFTSESPLKVRSIASPPSTARLEPLSPRPNPPPPLTENFSSQNLRTAFKIDPNIRPPTGSGGRGGTAGGDKSDSGGATSIGDRVSQQSFASGSVLPVITTKEARSRSYLEGSIGNGSPSMLGTEELDRYFPTRKVNILVGTWNMNEQKEVSYPLDDFILPERCDYIQDIYAFGTQENDVNKKEWEIKIQETLGPSHVMYHSVSLGSLHLVVFIRRDLIWFCSAPEDDVLSLRAVTMVKTKGAIGISLCLFGTSYLFINCHLTSDRDNDNTRKKIRLGDYFKVIQDMKLPKSSQLLSSSKKTTDITSIFDCVFWCGDLNFRIERKRHAVEGKVSQITAEEFPNFETLLGGDQLLKYMTEGKIFHGFQEGRINFHPTFKFDVNKDTYDSSYKSRVPSYTDRIMFRSKRKNDIVCVCYDAVMSIKHSDHKPVFGQFETVVRAGTDNLIYSAGYFDRSVYMEGNRRRAVNFPSKKKSNSKVCTVQ